MHTPEIEQCRCDQSNEGGFDSWFYLKVGVKGTWSRHVELKVTLDVGTMKGNLVSFAKLTIIY